MSDPRITIFENFLLESTFYCLNAMTSIQAKSTKATRDQIVGDVVSTIGISSTQYHGSISLFFGKSAFLEVSNKILNENHSTLDASCADAAAELLNIIYGYARTGLNRLGHDFLPAIPNVMIGSQIAASPSKTLSFYDKITFDDEYFFLVGTFGIAGK